MPTELGPAGPRDPLQSIYESEQRFHPSRRRVYAAAASVVVLGVFAGIVYYAYQEGIRAGSESVAPLIRADQQPYKVKPDEPGGMEIPNQDKLIYNEVAPNEGASGKSQVERLMPPPESPLPKPSPDRPPQQQSSQQQAATPHQATQAPAGPATASANPPKQVRPPGTPAYVPGAPVPANIPPVAEGAGQKPAQPTTPSPDGSTVGQGASSQTPTSAQPKAAQQPTKTASIASLAQSGGAWRVQLGSVRSSEKAQHEWARLQKQHPDLLGGLTLSVQRADLGAGKGVFYRIRGGALPDRVAANSLCARLKAAHVSCLVVKP